MEINSLLFLFIAFNLGIGVGAIIALSLAKKIATRVINQYFKGK